MDSFVKYIICLINTYFILLFHRGRAVRFGGCSFFKFKLHIKACQRVDVLNSFLEKGYIHTSGKNNTIEISNALLSEAEINIQGNENTLSICANVKLRKAKVIIRGTGCKVEIGNNTTFGGIRIINTGKNNIISIGSDCLFSDNIEIWASDTHPIYDEKNEAINPDKPVVIGNKVWVGSRVIILKGVTINDGSVIGIGSIVTKDVPPSVISVGSPNKTLKENIHWELLYR